MYPRAFLQMQQFKSLYKICNIIKNVKMQPLNKPIDVEFINRTFFIDDLKSIHIINQGRCFVWAYIAAKLYNHIDIWDTPRHAFVRSKLDNKYYDAECTSGVVNWKDLRVCNYFSDYYSESNIQIDLASYKKRWNRSAEFYDINWDKLNKSINNILKDING
jgi:hypothetical protein